DLDLDGDVDLALSTEWGPIRVYRQGEKGSWSEATSAMGLDRETWRGRWNSIAAADLDGDGRPDLVAGNWGRNTPEERHRFVSETGAPGDGWLRLYHGDFNADGVHDVLEAWRDQAVQKDRPTQPMTVVAASLPFVRGRFATHAAYGAATVAEVLGDTMSRAKLMTAGCAETGVFLQRAGQFEFRALPIEAQWAPVFGVVVADADGDGAEDLFLAQNFFAVRPHQPRFDAGVGCWLKGDGRGGFVSVSAARSGVLIHGEQRGAAVSDYDGDGRLDLVVGQNGAETRLFRNLVATPGVRVILRGPPANPAGIGARVGWVGVDSVMKEVQAGGGWLSQNGLAPLLPRVTGATEVRVVWPGGDERRYPVPPAPVSATAAMSVTATWVPKE
ncbi:MAG: VCBS repeat-containing protein, partial [Verrucomicrobiales bacterium]|nr:VCBS repeat-containing protein [Verrucomicrobiales bacterium]